MQKGRLSLFLAILLALITIGNFIWHIYFYRQDIFQKFDSKYWTSRYNQSQWAVPNSKNPIGDDGLYIYAGYRYLQGDDPTLLNAELPPFGKYIVGLFEVVTGYNGIFSVFFAGVSLILLFFFNKKLFSSSFWAILPVALFSFEPIFIEQIRAPFLDTAYLSFFLLGSLLVMHKKYLWAAVAFGLFMAIKSPFLIAVVYAALIIWFLFTRQFRMKRLVAMSVITLGVFILSYLSTFLHGHTIIYFLQVQKYIIHFYSQGAKGVIGAVFSLIFSGKWYNWFGPVQQIGEWTILWPITILGGIGSIIIYFKKPTTIVLFQLLWVGFYLAFLSITPIFARYLLLLLPFLYNLSIWSLFAVIKSRSS